MIALLLPISRLGVFGRRNGALLFTAVGLWAIARFVVAFTWRDAPVAAPLGTDQLLLLGVVAVVIVLLSERGSRARQARPLDSEIAAA